MSRIRVWTSEGKWSEEVVGLDKIFLLKHAIRYAWPEDDEFENGKYRLKDYSFNDNQPLIIKGPYNEDFEGEGPWRHILDPNDKVDDKILHLADINSFQMPLSVLKHLRDDPKYPYLSDVYNELIEAAKIPSGIKVVCLRLLFEDE